VVELTVNGHAYELEAPVGRTLAEALRLDLGLTGTKVACGEGHCGACTVPARRRAGALLHHPRPHRRRPRGDDDRGLAEHPLVDAFVRADALQCGFCTPGQIVSAAALVEARPEPTSDEVRHAMSGNLCRCGAYPKIEEAVLAWRG
jgi:aerobic-type carbon monoxide dehydrogenase small subunit (CoxS/CutS family)